MAVIGDLNAIDGVMGLAFYYRPTSVYWTRYLVADARDRHAASGEMGCSDTDDRSAMCCWVVQSYDIRHSSFPIRAGLCQGYHFP